MRDINRDKAAEVCPLARFSRYRPRETKKRSMEDVSKNVFGLWCGGINSDTSIAKQEKKKADRVENVTKTSIVADP